MKGCVLMNALLENIDKKRYKTALTADLTPLSLDAPNQKGKFAGSAGEVYETTLLDCTCPDFEFNCGELACKHMLRLAMELNLIPHDGMVSNIQSAYAKLYLGVLESFVKHAPLLDAMRLVSIIGELLKPSGCSCQNTDLAFAGVPSLLDSGLFEMTKKEKFKVKKDYKKGFNSIQKAMEARIGAFVMAHLEYEPLINVLKEMSATCPDK